MEYIMTIREYLKVDSFDRDLETGKALEHEEKYQKIINAIGKEKVFSCVPFSVEQIKHSRDPHLNDLSMKKWDFAAGYSWVNNRKMGTQDIIRYPSRLKDLLSGIGIDCFSNSDCVCILKQAAHMMIK
jgi:hypothetical protein